MCLTVVKLYHPNLEPKIAEKDIDTIKLAYYKDGHYYTYFQNMRIQFNNVGICEMKANMMLHVLHPAIVDKGIHSFKKFLKKYKNPRNLWMERGEYTVFFKAIIPEGTKYYIGRNNDIVSEKLIVKKINKIYLY